ncbi:MAG: (1-_4)-alpha-D-glucan 1-alpha-D-glucosylmutase [Gaiellaceae bacterium]|nr:(1->4)-alpha-D-glucan 1-alpha-D-glucosylmutase [Gaiellaceae bacterium]
MRASNAPGSNFRCTFRLQLTPDFGFRAARETVVPYVRELGASHLYLSPSLQARHGSTHGYDVVDPTRISEDLGGEDEFRGLCAAAREARLGVVLDVVPNHMAVSEENPFWADEGLRAKFFDWDPQTGWYRRFFDIAELAGVRVEEPEIFEATHAKILELVEAQLVDGLRIDHPDGLANPREYLERLRSGGVGRVWVEKILEHGERLRDSWPVEGTTGYEFANDVTALFVDPAGEGPLTELYAELTGERRGFADVAHEAKLEVARTIFSTEFERLRSLFAYERLEEAAAALHVYRTYVEPGTGRVENDDRRAADVLPDDLGRVVLLEGERSRAVDEFVVRWQQSTGPVMAKGVEDTAFYRYVRLTALNEVGGDPGRFWLAPADFHRAAHERLERHPLQLLASQTHDTKRAGDVRARIGTLAGMHEQWGERVRRWQELTGGMDDANEEYLLWQTLVGAWPIIPSRLEQYLEKALREAKRNSNWIDPNERHEARAKKFVRSLYENQAFLDDFEPFAQQVAAAGEHASLGALLLRLTSPGLPDIYQGDAFWSLNLVDPDNRRPVDWTRHDRVRRERAPRRETMKFHLIRRALSLRAEHPEAFSGSYEPLDLPQDQVGFVRGGRIKVVVPLRPGVAASGPGDLLQEFPQELSLLR